MQRLTVMIDGIGKYSSYVATQARPEPNNKDEASGRITQALNRCGYAETDVRNFERRLSLNSCDSVLHNPSHHKCSTFAGPAVTALMAKGYLPVKDTRRLE